MTLTSSIFGNDRRKLYYWSGVLCVILFVLLLIVVLAHSSLDKRRVPTFVGGYCALLATALSFFQILEHLTLFANPECQTKVVRILFMVPLYALTSWFSIMLPSASEYLDLIRDAYESYAIYAFFALMMEQMGGIDTVYRQLMAEERTPMPHFFPLCYLDPVKVTPRFVQLCRRSLFQFMVCKPLITLAIIILTANGKMGTGLFDVRGGTFWTTLAYNVSIYIAFTALVYFYTAMKPFLVGTNPLGKFVCIKAVVFLTFWQGMVILILHYFGLLPSFDYWSEDEVSTGLQDFIICIEMLFFAFAHKFCFAASEFTEEFGDEEGDEGDEVRRVLPPLRHSISGNLKFTMQHQDLRRDMSDIVHNR
jgi:hypothetical protein